MAVLGTGGRLILKREEFGDPVVVQDRYIDVGKKIIRKEIEKLWNGDRIYVIDFPGFCDGVPSRVSGFSMYQGGKWYLGPNRNHIASNTDTFYKKGEEGYPSSNKADNSFFYSKNDRGGIPSRRCADRDYYVHVSSLGYVSFYNTRPEALRGCAGDRIALAPVAGNFTIDSYSNSQGSYRNASWSCFDGPLNDRHVYEFSDFQGEAGASICTFQPIYDKPRPGDEKYANADLLPRNAGFPSWQVLAGIRQFTLNLDAPTVDVTAVSEKFGEQVKSLINGGGSFEFFIEREVLKEDQENSLMLMQLLMMTEKGCTAEAEFYLTSEGQSCGPICGSHISGSLYYKAKILVTQTAINLRPDDMVAGTAQFVTTSSIQLVQAP